MARGSAARLRRFAPKAFNKVAATRGGERCGTSKRGGRNRVCLAVAPIPGWKCGLNPINKLYACVKPTGWAAQSRGRKRAIRGYPARR